MTGNTVRQRQQAPIRAVDLLDLVELYEDCGRALTRTHNGPRERVSGSRSVGISLREEAVTARADIMALLAGWAGTVARSRGIAGPEQREARELVRFLVGNLDWLLDRPDAADFATAAAEAGETARRAIQSEPVPRTALGPCLDPGCQSTVYVEPAGPDSLAQHRVRCEAGHDWPPRQWLLLARRRATADVAAGDPLSKVA
ncbi:hypothetical protein [Streptomyces sp. HNM0574]|uniref:hypothetical protein n=1 Tax=Streptomyces sp. HNM0574 TaxID=2714954 RepID=UPI00146C2854|nr:hypothetical protein [Streptomyces sp. HNM0574]NLU70225.1 hypothetical protein [Streptomyces sp. HNM0574]